MTVTLAGEALVTAYWHAHRALREVNARITTAGPCVEDFADVDETAEVVQALDGPLDLEHVQWLVQLLVDDLDWFENSPESAGASPARVRAAERLLAYLEEFTATLDSAST